MALLGLWTAQRADRGAFHRACSGADRGAFHRACSGADRGAFRPAHLGGDRGAAFGAGRLGPLLLATVTGAAVALPYLFYVGYAAPRFLMPAYALLSLPVAQAVTGLRPPGRWRAPVTALLAAGVLAHLALQGAYAYRMAAGTYRDRERTEAAAAELRRLGVRPPCLVYGQSGVQMGYLLGCDSQGVTQRFAERQPERIRQAVEQGDQVVIVHTRVPLPPYAREWRSADLPGPWKVRFAP
jgi:hypothetical protein